jgi:hypothetical protein
MEGGGTMISIRSLSVTSEGWHLQEDSGPVRIYCDESGDIFSVHFFDLPPDLPGPLSAIDVIRDRYREDISDQGGIVGVVPCMVDSLPGLRTLFKFPQEPSGMSYVGALTIPRRDFSFVLKVCARERGITGRRDSVVMLKLRESGDLPAFDPGCPFEGWFADPYDPTCESRVRCNRSDDASWDPEFPDHPLSKCRRHLSTIEETCTFDQEVHASPSFEGLIADYQPARKRLW